MPKLPLQLNRLAFYPFGALPRSPSSLYTELLYSKHVEDLIKRLEPNLLYAHFAYPEGWTAYLAKVRLRQRIPLVVTLHGYDILVEPSVGYGIRLSKRYESARAHREIPKRWRIGSCTFWRTPRRRGEWASTGGGWLKSVST
jgi:hypothetical protein